MINLVCFIFSKACTHIPIMLSFVFTPVPSAVQVRERRVSRKYSPGIVHGPGETTEAGGHLIPSEHDFPFPFGQCQLQLYIVLCLVPQVKPGKDLFRQSVLPRLQRDKKTPPVRLLLAAPPAERGQGSAQWELSGQQAQVSRPPVCVECVSVKVLDSSHVCVCVCERERDPISPESPLMFG